MSANQPTHTFFIGSYTSQLGHVDGKGPGVGAFEVNSANGAIRPLSPPVAVPNPSFLWFDKQKNRLYTICEITDFEGKDDGALSVLSLDDHNQLRLLQQRSSNGSGPAYCSGDTSNSHLLVAHYVGGSFALFPIKKDGALDEPISKVQHQGSGPNPNRQEAPHAHAILAGPDNRRLYVADLGIDQIAAYSYDSNSGTIQYSDTHSLSLPSGSGPRHIVFHPTLPILYAALELTAEIARIRYQASDSESGKTAIYPSHNCDDATAQNHPSEILLSQDGRFLYIANRGLDCISIFEIDQMKGDLTWRADCPCGGRIPRHMALSPDDKILIVANQESDSVDTFFRDANTGLLTPSGHSLEMGTPCSIAF